MIKITMRKFWSSLVVVVLSLTACFHDEESNDNQTQQMLDENIAKWERAAIDRYQFVYRLSCFCGPPAGQDLLVTVVDGDITSVFMVSDNTPVDANLWSMLHTIDDMFGELQNALNQNAYRISVSYDNELGYPTSISIDYLKNAVDEELSLRAAELTAL